MFNLEEIKELVDLIDQSSVEELEIKKEDSRIRIRKASANASSASHALVHTAVTAPPVHIDTHHAQHPGSQADQASNQAGSDAVRADNLYTITSPMVGTFYCAPSPNAASFVNKGDKVGANTIVCIVEAMKLMNEIEAEVAGEIVDVLVEDGQLVEFGQPLFLVEQS